MQVGLECLCATNWLNPNVEDRFVHVIAHEYAHVQQARALVDDEHPTVLEMSLIEGAAEFVAEITSGEVSNVELIEATKGREKEIETAFSPTKTKLTSPNGSTTPRWKGPATSATGSDIASSTGGTQACPGRARSFSGNCANDRSEGFSGQERLVSRHSTPIVNTCRSAHAASASNRAAVHGSAG